MNTISADLFAVLGALRFRRIGTEVPHDIPASGVLDVHVNDGSAVTLGGGGATELVGIRYLDELGNPVSLFTEDTDAKVFRVASGVSITVRHNQTVDLLANALPAEQRIVTSSAKDFALENINSQAYFAYVIAAGGFRWFFVDRLNYNPADAVDWSPLPASFPKALDQLARRTPVLIEGSVELSSGVPVTVWSRAIDEAQTIGVRFADWTAAIDTGGGALLYSRGAADFVASRDTGGSTTVQNNGSPTENGTIPGGVLSTGTSSNDAIVQFTATTTATLVYSYRVTVDPIQF